MTKCAYKHCRNEAPAGKTHCRAHDSAIAAKDVIPGFSQQQKNKVDVASAEFTRFKTYCDQARAHIAGFLAEEDTARQWLALFFGDERVDVALKVVKNMSSVVDNWKTTDNRGRRFNVWVEPLYALTSTPNSCDVGKSIDLTVSPEFLENGKVITPWSQAYIIVHESAHGVHLVEPELQNELETKTFVADINYEPDGAPFKLMAPENRIVNADHYRACIKAFHDKGGDLDAEVIGKYQAPPPRARRVRSDSGVVRVERRVSGDVAYSDYVRDASSAVLQSCWLFMYNVFQTFGGQYQRKGNVHGYRAGSALHPMTAAQVKKIALGGKKKNKLKIKDILRLRDLYKVSRRWVDTLREYNFLSQRDTSLRGLENVEVVKTGGVAKTMLVKSRFRPDELVSDAALRHGVRQVIEQIIAERPYLNLTADDVIRMAQACHQSPGQWAADLNDWE